jgi:hypothetical protein
MIKIVGVEKAGFSKTRKLHDGPEGASEERSAPAFQEERRRLF